MISHVCVLGQVCAVDMYPDNFTHCHPRVDGVPAFVSQTYNIRGSAFQGYGTFPDTGSAN